MDMSMIITLGVGAATLFVIWMVWYMVFRKPAKDEAKAMKADKMRTGASAVNNQTDTSTTVAAMVATSDSCDCDDTCPCKEDHTPNQTTIDAMNEPVSEKQYNSAEELFDDVLKEDDNTSSQVTETEVKSSVKETEVSSASSWKEDSKPSGNAAAAEIARSISEQQSSSSSSSSSSDSSSNETRTSTSESTTSSSTTSDSSE